MNAAMMPIRRIVLTVANANPPGLDRGAAHRQVGNLAVAFFDETL